MEAAHMHKRNKRPPCRKIVLKLPDLDHAKSAVLNSLSSPHSRRNYKFAMEQFITWYCSEPRLALNRPCQWRGIGTDSVPSRPCFRLDNRTISGLQAESRGACKRPLRLPLRSDIRGFTVRPVINSCCCHRRRPSRHDSPP